MEESHHTIRIFREDLGRLESFFANRQQNIYSKDAFHKRYNNYAYALHKALDLLDKYVVQDKFIG